MTFALIALLLAVEEPTLAPVDQASPASPAYLGGLTRDEIQGQITPVMSQIKFCYEKELNKDGDLAGTLKMTWFITSGGAVTDATVAENTFRGPGAQVVGDCVKGIIARLRFPLPKGGGKVFVTYPFVFSSRVDRRPPPPAGVASPFGCGSLFAR